MTDPVIRVTPLSFVWETLDPFLFCVHHNDAYPKGDGSLGPVASLAGREIGQDFSGKDGWSMYHGRTVPGFPQHPHRGFETVTIVRKGLVDHSDSLGATARFGRGDVQWLTAGSGIVHCEMFPLVEREKDNPLELFQIWLNLPRSHKMVAPHFSMLWGHTQPVRVDRDAEGRETTVTVVAGALGEMVPPKAPPSSWASQPGSDLAIWTLKLAPNAVWTLPPCGPDTQRMLYYFRGEGMVVGGRTIPARSGVQLRAGEGVTLQNGASEAELLMLQGRPIGEPVVSHGPFVMNTQAEIRQTFMDYQRTRFGGWPWPSDGPTHPRSEGRFAKHVDGRIERPE